MYSVSKHPWPVAFILILLSLLGLEASAEKGTENLYYPGTEKLAANEMRVVALGTGTPQIRPAQVCVAQVGEVEHDQCEVASLQVGAAQVQIFESREREVSGMDSDVAKIPLAGILLT